MLMTQGGRTARLRYMPGTYRVLVPGDHVICAITHQPIPLSELKYWNADRQQAYASPEASLEAEGK